MRARRSILIPSFLTVAVLLGGCGGSGGGQRPTALTDTTGGGATSTVPVSGSSPATVEDVSTEQVQSAAASTAKATTVAAKATTTTSTAGKPLVGKIVGIDPGHNGRNGDYPARLNRPIWNGREWEGCDTTGTQTNSGYTEARYNWNVARYLAADLQRLGAKVVLTRHSNNGFGPCVDKRAYIIDHAHANVAVDIHADGGTAYGRGFTVLEPVADSLNRKVIGSSDRFARILRTQFLKLTHMPYSTYDGVDALQPRNNLAGLNLTTVPKVLIECGNMRNATDARMLTSAAFQQKAALAMTRAIELFLLGHD